MFQRIWKYIQKNVCFSILIMISCYLLTVFSVLIPSSKLEKQVIKSNDIIQKQGIYPDLGMDGTFLDNWTDADCIEISYNVLDANPLISALYSLEKTNNEVENGLDRLNCDVQHTDTEVTDFSYRWNGFKLWLRPLLAVFDLQMIRSFLFYINSVLMILISYLLHEHYGFGKALPFLAVCLIFNFQFESLSLLLFVDEFIAFVGCIAILYMDTDDERLYKVFIGCATLLACTSMLIIPVLTVGLPLVMWLIKRNEEDRCDYKVNFCRIVKYSFTWLIGYVLGLFSKGIVNRVAGINAEVGTNGIRWMHADNLWDRFRAIIKSVYNLFMRSTVRSALIILIIMLCLSWLIQSALRYKIEWNRYYCFVLLSLYPLGWAFVMPQHIGHGFTDYLFAISGCSMIYCVMDMRGRERSSNGVGQE